MYLICPVRQFSDINEILVHDTICIQNINYYELFSKRNPSSQGENSLVFSADRENIGWHARFSASRFHCGLTQVHTVATGIHWNALECTGMHCLPFSCHKHWRPLNSQSCLFLIQFNQKLGEISLNFLKSAFRLSTIFFSIVSWSWIENYHILYAIDMEMKYQLWASRTDILFPLMYLT